MSSNTSHNRANAAPSSFDIRKRRKKPFARVSTKTASAKRSLIAVRLKRGAYTTPEMIALERGNIELTRAGQGRAAAISSSNEIRRWASQRNLPPDQTAVAELTLTSTDWITSIEGRAGAAKTTTVGAIREFAEDQATLSLGSRRRPVRSSRFRKPVFPPGPWPVCLRANQPVPLQDKFGSSTSRACSPLGRLTVCSARRASKT